MLGAAVSNPVPWETGLILWHVLERAHKTQYCLCVVLFLWWPCLAVGRNSHCRWTLGQAGLREPLGEMTAFSSIHIWKLPASVCPQGRGCMSPHVQTLC